VAYDNIYQQCKGKGKTEATSKAWDAIFQAEDQETLRCNILCDYIAQFPDGREDKRAPRGKIDLTQYTHELAAKQSVEDIEATAKLDYEAFIHRMEHNRGGTPPKRPLHGRSSRQTPISPGARKGHPRCLCVFSCQGGIWERTGRKCAGASMSPRRSPRAARG
jgi:hypothetical protein